LTSYSEFKGGNFFETQCILAAIGGGSIGKCGRLSQPSWLLVRTII